MTFLFKNKNKPLRCLFYLVNVINNILHVSLESYLFLKYKNRKILKNI